MTRWLAALPFGVHWAWNDLRKARYPRLWWEWAEKPVDSMLTIDAAIHDAVMALPPDERRDRAKVKEAVRNGPQTWAVAPCRK